MTHHLVNWFTSVFNGFRIFWPTPKIDLPRVAEKMAAEYVVADGKIWFKQYFPEEGTRQEFKRAMLEHLDYQRVIVTMYYAGTATPDWAGEGVYMAPVYNGHDVVMMGTARYEVILPTLNDENQNAQEIAEVIPAGDGHEAGAQAGGAQGPPRPPEVAAHGDDHVPQRQEAHSDLHFYP